MNHPIKPAPARFILFLALIIVLPEAGFISSGNQLFSQVKRFTLLHTSDEHSALTPLPVTEYHPGMEDPSLGGFARLATLVNNIRNEKGDEPVLLFSSGDFIGGTPFAWLLPEGYSPEIMLMRATGYDAVTIGNHEFDYGPDFLAGYLLRAGYPALAGELPVIASNLDFPESADLARTGILRNHIFTLENGINLGVIGILGEEAYSVATMAAPAGIRDPVEEASRQVSALRDSGADIVVVLSHSGIEADRSLAAEVDGIDIILGGHDHIALPEPEFVNNTYIMHSGYYLQYLGVYGFEWDSAEESLRLVEDLNGRRFLFPVDSSVEEDIVVQEMVYEYIDLLNEFIALHTEGEFTDIREPVLWSDFSLTRPQPFAETAVGNFVTDAMRLMAADITGERVDVAFQGNGVLRADIVPAKTEWSFGEISFFDLVTVSGLGAGADGTAGYPVVSIYLTAGEIRNVLEISAILSQLMGDMYFLQVSGLRYTYDPGRTFWLRVPFGGPPIPSYRSVIGMELYTGEGIQDDENYIRIGRDGERLYHVVADYYLTSFLPMVGSILPRLGVVLKDRFGNPVEPEETIIMHNQREYKVWEALAMYAVSRERDEFADLPAIPDYYQLPAHRILFRNGIPLRYWSYGILSVTVAIIVLLAVLITRRWRRAMG